MSREEREKWDERFRRGEHVGEPAAGILERLCDGSLPLPKGRAALEIACGAGRNALWLAEHGWDTYACDVSLEGLRHAVRLARERGVSLKLFCADADSLTLPESCFDLIVVSLYLQRKLFPVIRTALRPGGLLIYRTYVRSADSGVPEPNPDHMLESGELARAFADFRVLHSAETPGKRARLAEFVGQKRSE